jgi:hypothetical protein
MNRLLSDTELERHILGMAVFLILLYAGLLLVNYLEPCEHGRYGLAAPCHDPLEDIPRC